MEANEHLGLESHTRARRLRRSCIWDFVAVKRQIKPEDTLVSNKDLAIANMIMTPLILLKWGFLNLLHLFLGRFDKTMAICLTLFNFLSEWIIFPFAINVSFKHIAAVLIYGTRQLLSDGLYRVVKILSLAGQQNREGSRSEDAMEAQASTRSYGNKI
ncbi:Protein of unknown function [Pyronema omphalodes CBS 100304]|uniref:Uncharacterized protein n=1 Tax=Pyronema omphalodes (strain CBS 100304) TaxID=1076935 RepID=U4L234_PYROM|nr:Protein of unknown function [Pyronema omphalodes CBS 100304]